MQDYIMRKPLKILGLFWFNCGWQDGGPYLYIEGIKFDHGCTLARWDGRMTFQRW